MDPKTTPPIYPCRYPVKVIGASSKTYVAEVLSIFRARGEEFREETVRRAASRGGKYISLTVYIVARNREHLESLYAELTAHPSVMIVL